MQAQMLYFLYANFTDGGIFFQPQRNIFTNKC